MAEYTPRYAYNQKSEAQVIHEKITDHCKILQRILIGKKAAYGLHIAETLVLEAVGILAGELTGSMKIESEELMSRKIADHSYTIGDMLLRVGSGIDDEYERTAQEEILWNVVKGAMKGRSPYVPRS